MRLASLLLTALLASACGPGEPSDRPPTNTVVSLQESPSKAAAALTLTRTYDCLLFVHTGMTSFSIQHLVNVMSDGSVISTCHLDGALQGSGSSVFQGDHPEAEKGQCVVHASANGTATGESWTLNLYPHLLSSEGTYHKQNSAQDGLRYRLACNVR
ncbi:hypothetical protein CYFUS_008885 [Cystobacter fuscus]|uniref:Lipoprotein n=1 Tax=Cystobacter fuscus TaxID=43 RepID=A0A250JHP9_9BACT|nr:hypothetical protein [Cystobacter fuscus]ATB43405.1 hypothetical protein CYFUS_008885 [Cystobacter fuscus]